MFSKELGIAEWLNWIKEKQYLSQNVFQHKLKLWKSTGIWIVCSMSHKQHFFNGMNFQFSIWFISHSASWFASYCYHPPAPMIPRRRLCPYASVSFAPCAFFPDARSVRHHLSVTWKCNWSNVTEINKGKWMKINYPGRDMMRPGFAYGRSLSNASSS